jgi:cytochrome P450
MLSGPAAVIGLSQLLALVWLVHRLLGGSARSGAADKGGIPDAQGGVPLLGHALRYKHDAPAFLREQCERAASSVFRVNLAGKRMVVVGANRQAIIQTTNAAESVLSARAAVQAIGFAEVLGDLNVLHGTDFHKRVLKAWLSPRALVDEVAPLHGALADALAHELGRALGTRPSCEVADLLQLVRRCVLRAAVERMLGAALLKHAGERLLDEMMRFQDALEDAIAKASVLPRLVALPLVLWPVRRARARLCALIAKALAAGSESDGYGPWLRAFEAENTPLSDRAELVVGLLFAAHKNPAIGAAQAFLLAREHGGAELVAMRAEAARLGAAPDGEALGACVALRRCALETCRVTAHSIGAVRTVVAAGGFALDAGAGTPPLRVRRGETIALAHITANLDVRAWGADADAYNPTRPEWLDATAAPDGALLASKGAVDEYKFTTFSQGLHKCPGERIALVIMQLVTACLLAGPYVVEPILPLPPVSFERATLAQRAGPVRLRVTRAAAPE